MKSSTGSLKKEGKNKTKKDTRQTKQGLISQAEYARVRGVSRTAIHKHVKNGTITLVQRLIDPDKADQQLRESLDHEHLVRLNLTEGYNPEEDLTIKQAKALKEQYQAKLAELVYKEKAGEFIKEKGVRDANENIYRVFRDRMLNIPNRISAILAAEESQEKVFELLDKEIKRAIEKAV